ncbi:SRPBCC family protein [Pseudonocardia alaniniphila]|uniref:SRPBCC family protein n=1 Tax=Pseudonocardia alaniniphila TaxID=75291 RepID=A0ABS9TRY8_9PSEU|nr:SRPBCC family protein [Pseudonocardia alaniniphila]MCH6171315.1 SRPBCC family protein [Pseudonocardia alaniniphila]
MTKIQESIDVAVPASTAYNQWTQFESFPDFMDGVERIEQVTPTRTHWVTRIAGVEREFEAEITEQHPDERIAWKTDDGTHQAGVVTFHRLDDTHTRVMLQLDHEPQGLTEKAGDALGIIQKRTKGDLKNFKQFIENRGHEEGGWRGDVGRSPQQPVAGAGVDERNDFPGPN